MMVVIVLEVLVVLVFGYSRNIGLELWRRGVARAGRRELVRRGRAAG